MGEDEETASEGVFKVAFNDITPIHNIRLNCATDGNSCLIECGIYSRVLIGGGKRPQSVACVDVASVNPYYYYSVFLVTSLLWNLLP